MSEMGSVENLESENEDLESNNAESGEEDQRNENMNAELEANDGQGSEQSKLIKPKKIVRNPQPKLNADTLRGPKGLVALEKVFKHVKFKGPGHEQEDLNHLMKTYEYWCNRLFPKYPFDECISKIEKLGSKKIVQTYVKKIRLGMLDDDHNENDVVEDDEEIEERDGWDEIFDSLGKESSTPIQIQLPELVSQQVHKSKSEEEVVLSEEVKERIRKNQEQARKIREEKLKSSQLQNNNCSKINISNVEDVEILNTGEHQCDSENNVMNAGIMETNEVNESEKNGVSCKSNIDCDHSVLFDTNVKISKMQVAENSGVTDATASIHNFSTLVSDMVQLNSLEEHRKATESSDNFNETVSLTED